jgi:hypothetical protein
LWVPPSILFPNLAVLPFQLDLVYLRSINKG